MPFLQICNDLFFFFYKSRFLLRACRGRPSESLYIFIAWKEHLNGAPSLSAFVDYGLPMKLIQDRMILFT